MSDRASGARRGRYGLDDGTAEAADASPIAFSRSGSEAFNSRFQYGQEWVPGPYASTVAGMPAAFRASTNRTLPLSTCVSMRSLLDPLGSRGPGSPVP